MKKTVVLAICISFSILFLNAENNQSIQIQQSADSNQSKKKDRVEKQIQEQIKEKKSMPKSKSSTRVLTTTFHILR